MNTLRAPWGRAQVETALLQTVQCMLGNDSPTRREQQQLSCFLVWVLGLFLVLGFFCVWVLGFFVWFCLDFFFLICTLYGITFSRLN